MTGRDLEDRVRVYRLAREAVLAGDAEMVQACTLALAGDAGAWDECMRAIAEAAAQCEEGT